MNTLDLDALEKFTRKAQELQAIAEQLRPFLELIKTLDGKDFTIPTDRFIGRGEVRKILHVGAGTIKNLIAAGSLTPLYIAGSNEMKFRLSEVLRVPQKKPWHVGGEQN